MPVPGYDPDDIETVLETQLTETELDEMLSARERDDYENGDASLVDLLGDEQIDRVLDHGG
jgi:hypothetical protein